MTKANTTKKGERGGQLIYVLKYSMRSNALSNDMRAMAGADSMNDSHEDDSGEEYDKRQQK